MPLIKNTDCTSLAAGDIRFYDNYVPTLPVGDYIVNLVQNLNPTVPEGKTKIDECYPASQVFSVQGPRYVLPDNEIFSVFPPENSQGVFNQFLPNIVMVNRELPWERNVFNDGDPSKQTPWMALLLFYEDEQMLLEPNVPEWQKNPTMVASLAAEKFYQDHGSDGILWPALEKEWYESDEFLKSTSCNIIDISPAAFTTLVSAKEDLKYLAHVRQVDPTAKDSSVLMINGKGWYSVIVGRRLPAAPGPGKPGKKNIAHLVSLEGLQDYVGGAKAFPSGTTRVRMISYKSWSFTCLPELGESFSDTMNGLLKDVKGNDKATDYRLQVSKPVDTSAQTQHAYQALQNGYVPLSFQTRSGEQTFSWYRGPFSPIPVKKFIQNDGKQTFNSSSGAIVYDKVNGIFDVSYAVAFETGRQLALSDKLFGKELLHWQRKGHSLTDLILERKSQAKMLRGGANMLNAESEGALLSSIESNSVTMPVMANLIENFSSLLTPEITETETPLLKQYSLPAHADSAPLKATPHTLVGLMNQSSVKKALRSTGVNEADFISTWLGKLYLLNGVPFETLTPMADMLPKESVRFFYIDQNWLNALLEGALSIGVESSRDRLYHETMKDVLDDATTGKAQKVRDDLLGDAANQKALLKAPKIPQPAVAGMLLRSAVVGAFPGIEVNGYEKTLPQKSDPDTDSFIKLLHMVRLSDELMLCLWPTIPAVVTIDEPKEGIAFGFEDPPKGNGYYLYLRSQDKNTYGQPLSGDQYQFNAQNYFDSNHLLKITGSGGIVSAIQNALPNKPAVNVRDFSMQMIKVPERAIFANPKAKGGN